MAKIICFTQFKGGTGKTSSTLNISVALAQLGFKVLSVDTDQQANLTIGLGIDPTELNFSMKHLLTDESVTAAQILVKTGEGVDLLPSNLDLALVEMSMSPIQRELVLSRKLDAISNDYDFVCIDTAPNFIMTTVNAMSAADYIIVPVEPHPFCLYGLSQLTQSFELVRRTSNQRLQLLGLFITLYDARESLPQQIIGKLRHDWQNLVFETIVRKRAVMDEAMLKRRAIVSLHPTSDLAQDYLNLTQEVINRVQTAN